MIYDPRVKKDIEVKDIEKKIHQVHDSGGNIHAQEYVEFTVIGHNTEWQDFILLDEFLRFNPEIRLEE